LNRFQSTLRAVSIALNAADGVYQIEQTILAEINTVRKQGQEIIQELEIALSRKSDKDQPRSLAPIGDKAANLYPMSRRSASWLLLRQGKTFERLRIETKGITYSLSTMLTAASFHQASTFHSYVMQYSTKDVH